jgi:hypothetical protein
MRRSGPGFFRRGSGGEGFKRAQHTEVVARVARCVYVLRVYPVHLREFAHPRGFIDPGVLHLQKAVGREKKGKMAPVFRNGIIGDGPQRLIIVHKQQLEPRRRRLQRVFDLTEYTMDGFHMKLVPVVEIHNPHTVRPVNLRPQPRETGADIGKRFRKRPGKPFGVQFAPGRVIINIRAV